MRQAVALVALLAIPWAGSASAAGSPSELLALSYGIADSTVPANGRSSSLPARLEELLLKPEIAMPAPVAVAVPYAAPTACENLWDRIRAGFAMDDLDSPLVDR